MLQFHVIAIGDHDFERCLDLSGWGALSDTRPSAVNSLEQLEKRSGCIVQILDAITLGKVGGLD